MVNPRDVSPGVDDAPSPTRILGEDDFITASSPMTWGMDRSCQPRHSHARAGVNQETVIFDDSDSGIIKIFADFLSFCIFLPGNLFLCFFQKRGCGTSTMCWDGVDGYTTPCKGLGGPYMGLYRVIRLRRNDVRRGLGGEVEEVADFYAVFS